MALIALMRGGSFEKDKIKTEGYLIREKKNSKAENWNLLRFQSVCIISIYISSLLFFIEKKRKR